MSLLPPTCHQCLQCTSTLIIPTTTTQQRSVIRHSVWVLCLFVCLLLSSSFVHAFCVCGCVCVCLCNTHAHTIVSIVLLSLIKLPHRLLSSHRLTHTHIHIKRPLHPHPLHTFELITFKWVHFFLFLFIFWWQFSSLF